MTSDRILELLVTLGIALLGGGGLWTYFSGRRKSKVESEVIATKSAIDTMRQTMDSLKERLDEMTAENEGLRLKIDQEREEHKVAVAQTVERMNYFQNELQVMHSENARLREQIGMLGGGRRAGDLHNPTLFELRQEIMNLKLEIAELKETSQ